MDLRIEGVTHRYVDLDVLHDIELEIQQGRIVCVVDPSGCGKSTFLRIIGGLEQPSPGSVPQVGEAPAGSLNPLSLFVALIAFWGWGSSSGFILAIVLPTPSEVWSAFSYLVETGLLCQHAGVSLQRLAVGWTAGTVLGICVGFWIGLISLAHAGWCHL